MASRVGFAIGLGPTREGERTVRESGEPLRILALGDFSGRCGRLLREAARLADRPALRIDIDNFDAVFDRLAPTLRLHALAGHDELELELRSLEDFHPDRLYTSAEAFRSLRESRARLTDPATFDAEADRLTATEGVAPAGSAPATSEDRDALLRRIIGSTTRSEHRAETSSRVVDRLIRDLIGSAGASGSGRSPVPYLTAVDATLSELMRSVLHDPAFQSLEADWRGLRRFVESVDLGERLTLQILDLGRSDLEEDLLACGGDVRESAAHRLIAAASQRGADARPWSLLVGLYRFGASDAEVTVLERLAELAARLGSPMIVDAEPSLAGCRSLQDDTDPRNWSFPGTEFEARWSSLRRGPWARWLGLALPRVLLRVPYGARTESIESFEFEETGAEPRHEDYLWGSAALACAQAMAAAAVDGLDGLTNPGPHEIEDLPACARRVDGESVLQPCAEFLLSLQTGEELSRRGLSPLMSYANRNAVRITGVQSISDPRSALAVADAAARHPLEDDRGQTE